MIQESSKFRTLKKFKHNISELEYWTSRQAHLRTKGVCSQHFLERYNMGSPAKQEQYKWPVAEYLALPIIQVVP